MSIGASLSSFEYEDRKINLIDTPGEPSFVAEPLGGAERLRERRVLRQRRDGRRGVDRPPLAARGRSAASRGSCS